jgi:hypothetical protein
MLWRSICCGLLLWDDAMRWVCACLFFLCGPLFLGVPVAQAALTGSLGIAENACASTLAKFFGVSCSYSGGGNIPEDLAAYYAGGWIGPIDSGGFYASIAGAPGFTLSTQTGFDAIGTPLTSFLVGVPSSPGDGKVAPMVSGNITMRPHPLVARSR